MTRMKDRIKAGIGTKTFFLLILFITAFIRVPLF